MALRAIAVLQQVCTEMEAACPAARIYNYTNPVNIVAQAIAEHSPIDVVSLCEGPIYFVDDIAELAELDPGKLEATMVGLNHGCWSVEHSYSDGDLIELIQQAWERRRDDPGPTSEQRRTLRLAATMEAIPADYFGYYYFRDEVLAELQARPTDSGRGHPLWSLTTGALPRTGAEPKPHSRPGLSRGGIHELELAIDVMDAVFNDKDEVHPVNVVNRNGALAGFDEQLVVEVPAAATLPGSGRSPRRRCRPACAGWSRCWPSTSGWPRQRPGMGLAPTVCAR